ncbi:hypothetical protein Amsp01_090140 [Amycolatopsis sp. NBRC 101858]|uniref:hypothetical protein n=1 Tax=Amycolatopsis sp. NBRC 101858 TaxID=3032200 RepID=UPI0024A5C9D2|nr:hypothetical protein [Amycolatopsis sp. NBRC 101858]GLY42991.1 hypothetical protein Amsp01_090140 [Amycolatopsis sp. NBRC 101858]
MTTYLTASEAIGVLPDASSDTLFVIGFPTRAADPITPAVLAFPSADITTLHTPAMGKHVHDQLPAGSNADLLIVVVGNGQDNQQPLPHRAAIAALETALRPAGHTVVGCYWTPHTQPGAILRDYREPHRISAILPTTTPLDLTPPLRIVADAALPWGLPFTERGESIPTRLGRFARAVLPLLVRCDDHTHHLVELAIDEAGRGEFPDDENGFAITCALRDNALYGPRLLPPFDLDLRRVEQLWMALYRGNADRKIRAKLAALISASALRRRARHFAAYALAHAAGAPGGDALSVLLQQRIAGAALDRKLERLAARIAASDS